METREAFRAIIDATQAADPVPCGSCTACCRHHQLVEVRHEWGDDPILYAETQRTIMGGRPAVVLKHNDAGECVYLCAGQCSIYDIRPIVCRGFDCRRNWLSYTPQQRVQATAARVVPAQVFAAGEARLATLNLQPGEAEIFTEELGARVLNGRGKA